MTSLSVSEVRQALADLLNRVAYKGERIVIERRGKGLAALVSQEDLALLESLEDRVDLEAARKALKEKGSVPWDDVKADLEL
ncbi:MAG: type II toxin-antitoxin system Phd/YefM family antitoxin [Phycisphaerae bacterium]